MRRIISAILLLAVLAIFLWSQYFNVTWQYLFLLRVPLVMGILLFSFPFIAVFIAATMLNNLFVLNTKGQLAFVISAAIMAGMSIALGFDVILSYAPLRFDLPEWNPLSKFWLYVLSIGLAAPTIIFTTWLSVDIDTQDKVLGIVMGVAITVLVLFFTSVMMTLDPPQKLTAWVMKIFEYMPKDAQKGIVDTQASQLKSGHMTAAGFFIVALIVYVFGFVKLRPRVKASSFQTPTLFFIMLIIMMLTLFFGAVTFFFDISRVPVVILFMLLSFITYGFFNVDHFYEMKPDPQGSKPSPVKMIDALNLRLDKQGSDERTLIVVCASGGGIQAAGWMTKVLTGFQQILGDEFAKAIGLISSVSGGAVGTMHYLDHFSPGGYPEQYDLKRIFENSTKESLDATGWGLAYPDFWRLIGLPFLPPKLLDRGTVIEVDWKSVMKHPHASFATWREKIMQGALPVPVFNATLVEDGRRFLLTPMTFGENLQGRHTDFNSLYTEYDIDVTTAARLSATFPYVTPICRNDKGKQVFHIADGGYFDNFGVFTALQWLDKWVLPANEQLKIKRVVVLQINAFPDFTNLPPSKEQKGWVVSVAGPLMTLFQVRTSTQIARNDREISNLKRIWKNEIDLESFTITFPRMPSFSKEGQEYTPPLSWKLTNAQIRAIEKAWDIISADSTGEVRKLEAAWQKWHS